MTLKKDLKNSIEKYITTKEEDMPEGLQGLLKEHNEYKRISLKRVVIQKQVRTNIDTDDEQFKALIESIKEKGVLQPILVSELPDGNYRLIAGERRYRASAILELKSIPAIIKEKTPTENEILALQLIENLQRENIAPLDEAQGYLDLFALHAGAQDVGECMNNLMLYQRSPERVKNEFVATVATIQKISGKSITSVRNLLSLLQLPDEIRNALSDGVINLSHGYVFASHLEHPRLDEIFEKAVEGKFTKDALVSEFKKEPAKKKPKKEPKKKGLQMLEFVNDMNVRLEKARKEIEGSDTLLSAEDEKKLRELFEKFLLQAESLMEVVMKKKLSEK